MSHGRKSKVHCEGQSEPHYWKILLICYHWLGFCLKSTLESKEFDSAASAEAHCQIAMQQIPDLIIKFDTGVLVQVDEI
jgi:hypothetical protein